MNDAELADKIKAILHADGATAAAGRWAESPDLPDRLAEAGDIGDDEASRRRYYVALAHLKRTGQVRINEATWPVTVQLI